MYERLLHLLDRGRGAPVAILGDYMLDQYLYGDAERISPEAPVPVLRVVGRESALGGAGSVAAGVAALEGRAFCIGVVGEDAAGTVLRQILTEKGVQSDGLLSVPGRPTTVKTRLVGLAQHRHRQQLVRMDEEDATAINAAAEAELLRRLTDVLAHCRVLCIQDYGKGVVTPDLCQAAILAGNKAGVPVLVDPMRSRDASRYAGATVATPNRTETEWLTGLRLPACKAVEAARDAILKAMRTTHVCVTLDAEGCALIGPGGQFEHLATKPRDVYDVTGAGDAVLAAMAVGLAGGAALREAAMLANVAGGLEVEKFGCVPITRAEMVGEIMLEHGERLGKRRTVEHLLPELARRRARGQRIVFTNGCFDILHRGHVDYLARCREEGDVVVVGLNTDASVRRQNKAADRPVNPQDDRAAVLEAMSSVDYVVLFDEETPAALIEAIRPDVLVKGEDWKGRAVAGQATVESLGGKVVFAPLVEGRSTTAVIERIRGVTR